MRTDSSKFCFSKASREHKTLFIVYPVNKNIAINKTQNKKYAKKLTQK